MKFTRKQHIVPLLAISLILLPSFVSSKTDVLDDEDWTIVERDDAPPKKSLSKSKIISKLNDETSKIFGQNKPYILYVNSNAFFKATELNKGLFETIGQAIKFIENNMGDSFVLKKQMVELRALYHQILREPILLGGIVQNLLPESPKQLDNPFESKTIDYTSGSGKELDSRLKKLAENITKLQAGKTQINDESFYLSSNKKDARAVMDALIDQLIVICKRVDFVIRHIMCLADPKTLGSLCRPGDRGVRFERKG